MRSPPRPRAGASISYTIFERKVAQGAAPPSSKKRAASCSTEPGYSQATNKTRSAFEKRERARIRQGLNKSLVTATPDTGFTEGSEDEARSKCGVQCNAIHIHSMEKLSRYCM